jgi:hypothetical protein
MRDLVLKRTNICQSALFHKGQMRVNGLFRTVMNYISPGKNHLQFLGSFTIFLISWPMFPNIINPNFAPAESTRKNPLSIICLQNWRILVGVSFWFRPLSDAYVRSNKPGIPNSPKLPIFPSA